MTQKNKKEWIDPVINELGEAKDLIEGGAPGEGSKNIWIR